MRLRLAPSLRKPPPIFASGKHFVQLYHWQTSHTQERYTKFCRLSRETHLLRHPPRSYASFFTKILRDIMEGISKAT